MRGDRLQPVPWVGVPPAQPPPGLFDLYVVIALLGVCRSLGRKTVVAWGLTLGLMLGFATDFVLVAAGG